MALLLIGFFAGVLASGYVFAVLAGIKTELAVVKVKLANDLGAAQADVVNLKTRLMTLETKL